MFENLFSSEGGYSRAMNWLWNVLILAVLWLLCSLPIFTIGASGTAAYYAAAKVIRHNTGSIIPEFFSSFRTNFRQSLGLTFLFLGLFAFVLAECVLIYFDTSFPLILLYMFYALAAAVYLFSVYLWACLSRFAGNNMFFVRMSFILVFRHLPTSILLLLLHLVTVIAIFLMPWGLIVFPGICLYTQTFLMEKILLKYSPAVSDDDPASQMWYYQ